MVHHWTVPGTRGIAARRCSSRPMFCRRRSLVRRRNAAGSTCSDLVHLRTRPTCSSRPPSYGNFACSDSMSRCRRTNSLVHWKSFSWSFRHRHHRRCCGTSASRTSCCRLHYYERRTSDRLRRLHPLRTNYSRRRHRRRHRDLHLRHRARRVLPRMYPPPRSLPTTATNHLFLGKNGINMGKCLQTIKAHPSRSACR